jgi:signal transduction histidine kinase
LPGRWVLPVVVTGYAVASVGLVLTISTPTSYPAVSTAAAGVALVAGLGLIAVGMLGVWDRASMAVAPVAVALGVVWCAPGWVGWSAGPSILRSVALVVAPFLLVLLVHLGLAFPAGRPRARRDRVAVGAVYLATCGYSLVRAGVRDPFRDVHCWANCADNVFLVSALPGLARALDTAWLWTSVAVGLLLAAELVRRLWVASRAGRGLTWPVLVPVAVAALGEATYAAALLRDPAEDPSGQLFAGVFVVRALALAAVAGGLAWAWGRQRWARRALSGLAADLGDAARPGTLSETLARALGDVSAQVGYWLPGPGRYVDRDGRDLGALDTAGRARTRIERNGVLVAVVLHDPGVTRARDLQAEIGPATALAIDNERLRAGVLAQVEDLRASRARVVQASDAARQQLERDLHDGAQQRLLAVTYELRLARAAAHTAGDPEVERVLASATDQAHAVVAQLRDLAHGVYPAILTEAGLGPAVWSLADEAPLPVEVDRVPQVRFPTPVERAAFVVVGHGIDLAARSGADHMRVDVVHADGVLTVTIAPMDRAPEVHVVDRVGALGGQVTLAQGMLCAEVPCG